MAAGAHSPHIGEKRKRASHSEASKKIPSERTRTITLLESGIKDSQKNYNDIAKLLQLAREEPHHERAPASLALCRVFCRLLADGRLVTSQGTTNQQVVVSEWLRSRYREYKTILLPRLNSQHVLSESSWALVVQLLKEEVAHAPDSVNAVWKTGFFPDILSNLCDKITPDLDCEDFALKFMQPYDDVRHYTFVWISRTLREQQPKHIVEKSLIMLSAAAVPQQRGTNLKNVLCPSKTESEAKGISFSAHRKQAQQAWMSLLKSNLQKEPRKRILNIMTARVIPWFQNVEVLMDFHTDSYDVGGATSLLALSGLFHLMQEKNLDYPDFYPKLYSLLDHNLLHSKHRSRFFRLLETFLSSTHLPAAIVASFIKRLSRLALHAPPAGIVAILPWIYNMLQAHPTCTFMIHREARTSEERDEIEEDGAFDPFDMEEPDPIKTQAIDSCLWELETLRSHYHPNVGSLAGIIAEQFTKRSYNLEDFLDHSYSSQKLVESELGKTLKKTPVVEFEIPKTIFKQADGDSHLEELMMEILEYQS